MTTMDGEAKSKGKSEKKEKGKRRQSGADVSESKEEKRVRKEAKKKAMAVDLGVAEAGPSSSMSRLVSSKSEMEVARLLDPDLEDDGQATLAGPTGIEQAAALGNGEATSGPRSKKEKKANKEKHRKGEKEVADEDKVDLRLEVKDAKDAPEAGAKVGQASEKTEGRKIKKAKKEQQLPEDTVTTTVSEGKVKKKSRKSDGVEVSAEASEPVEKVSKEKRKGKRKAGDQDEVVEEGSGVSGVNGGEEPAESGKKDTGKKKRKKEGDSAIGNELNGQEGPTKGEKKQSKRKRTEADPATPQAGEDVEPKSKKKQKKSKAQDGPSISIDDIDSDEALSESAKKALIYVHQHSTSHLTLPDPGEAWKFNKARQNWLVKHVWEGDQIPTRYMGLVLGYLKTIQGKGRAHLIDMAKRHSQDKPKVTTQDPEQEQVEQALDVEGDVKVTVETVDSTATKRVGFAESTEEMQPEQSEEVQAEEERDAERVERAKGVLKALGAR